MQPGPRPGVLAGRGHEDGPGDHEPVSHPASLRGPGERDVAGEAAAAPAQPQRQHPVDPGVHGQGGQGARGVGERAHPEAPHQRQDCLPLAAPAARCPRVRAWLMRSEPAVRELPELGLCWRQTARAVSSADHEEDSTSRGWALNENWRPPCKWGLLTGLSVRSSSCATEPESDGALLAVSLDVTTITPQPTVRAFLGKMCVCWLVTSLAILGLSNTWGHHPAPRIRELVVGWKGQNPVVPE